MNYLLGIMMILIAEAEIIFHLGCLFFYDRKEYGLFDEE